MYTGLLTLIALRATPFWLFAIVGKGHPVRLRCFGAAGVVTVATVLARTVGSWGAVMQIAGVWGLLAGATAVLSLVQRAYACWMFSRVLLFVACTILFVAVPAWASSSLGYSATARAAVVVLGWEMQFAAFSYCVESASAQSPPGWRKRWFFLLVDPTLVYPLRGTRQPKDLRGRIGSAGRALVGIAVIGLQWPLGALLVGMAPQGPRSLSSMDVVHQALALATLAASLYAAHSGLASLQIGLAGIVGYRLPERYRFPFLARSPTDFWRRWNIWLGQWVKRYLFTPLVVSPRRSGQAAWLAVLGLVATFLAIGILHDLPRSLTRGEMTYDFAKLFFVFALVAIAWRSASPALRLHLAGGRLLSFVVFVPVQLLLVWIALPILAGP